LAVAAILAAMALQALFSGCSWLPKVTVIDDPLEKAEHLSLGLAYEKDGETELAEREYRLAQPLPVASLALGNLFFHKGDLPKAENYYRQALAREKLPQAANNLAWLYLTEGRKLEKARELSLMAIDEAKRQEHAPEEIRSYQGTLELIEKALAVGKADGS
jgi:Flp pilus assembly protein TadD